MVEFNGIWVPLVTPFRAGAVDRPALRQLVQHLAAQGVAGFVACGSTGEAAMLTDAEQAGVLATTLDAAGGKPVLMGLAGVDAAAIARRAQALAAQHRPAGWLLAPPPYVKPSQAGIVQHFHTVASATPLPLVAYDIPARTGVRIQPGTLMALADHPQIRAVKDCSGDRAAAEAVLADGRLALLGGNDIDVVVISNHVEPNDMAALTAVGIAPDRLKYLMLKSRIHWRAGLRPMSYATVECAGTGVCSSDYALLGLHKVRRPIYPIDAM